jgi:magnesium-transporting ATPase (P-type)
MGLHLEWSFHQSGMTTQNGLKIIMLSCTGFFFIFSTITRGLQFWYMLFTMASNSKLNICSNVYHIALFSLLTYMNMNIWMGLNLWIPINLKRDHFNCCSKEHFLFLNPFFWYILFFYLDTLYTIFEGLRGKSRLSTIPVFRLNPEQLCF